MHTKGRVEMQTDTDGQPLKRRAANLTIRTDVLELARALHVNTSRAAEAGIIRAIREVQAREWLRGNKAAIEAHNARVDKDGTLLTPDWAAD
ncbi:type II toxin-antitoxin system CcdA family antitoxin [Eilatimonas milleporae]|uniref:Antitoxin CcdA n=1 Tax=Eilatimonas milleporae TaxID=911205 RepID=A0A3M0C7M2_9PROT|nr:type II toxin-antitoxin system CcdA family antitoxin [Eilatimonas milleporae]RMB04875.1 antitoxin CcdA [Eilatimonas milleporae]